MTASNAAKLHSTIIRDASSAGDSNAGHELTTLVRSVLGMPANRHGTF